MDDHRVHGEGMASGHPALAGLPELVRAEVEKQLAREQKLLRDSLGTAVRIVGAAATLFLAVFTIFGLRTWDDIKKETARIVTQQAEALIVKADSETNLKDTLNNLLNRAVVHGQLIERQRREPGRVTLSQNDWERLRSWITREDLPVDDFSDALAVLNSQSEDRKKTDVSRVLNELLNPPGQSLHGWIRKQPEKTRAILANFKHVDLGYAASQLLASDALTDSVKNQAAAYLAEVRYTEGADKLLKAYAAQSGGSGGTSRQPYLVAAMSLAPWQPELLAQLRQLVSGEQPTTEKLKLVLDLLSEPVRAQEFRDAWGERENFRSTWFDILKFAHHNGLRVELVEPRIDAILGARLLLPGNRDADAEPKVALVAPAGSGGITRRLITVADFNQLLPYFGLLSKLAEASDIATLRWALPQIAPRWAFAPEGQVPPRLRISAEGGVASVVTAEGKKDLELGTLQEAHVTRSGSRTDPEATLHWTDAAGQHNAKLVALKGSKYTFKLEAQRSNPPAQGVIRPVALQR